ncbi:MAG TPA: PilZ domain-containing protein, partial [Thermoanaerobaculia bacterium]
MPRSSTPLSREDAARVLGLAPPVIDALIASGAVLCRVDEAGQDAIPPEQFETLFRDSLLRLYHAQATAAPPVVAAERAPYAPVVPISREPELTFEMPEAAPDAPQITHGVAEFEEPAPKERDLRLAQRYVPRKQIGGTFNSVRFNIVQLSNTGLRIRHEQPLHAGDEGKLTFTVLGSKSFLIKVKVVWTSIGQQDGASS